MDSLRGIETFIKAVETGSIAGAARSLGISSSAASQNIARLESQVNAKLLTRTTRQLALTDSGSIYYEKVSSITRDLDLAGQAISNLNEQPQGKLCIASTVAFSRYVLAPLIPAFTQQYPRISIELISTDRKVNHIKESVDISIRIAEQLEDGLIAILLASVPSKFCASPAYLTSAGCPTLPEELKEHSCLAFRYPVTGKFLPWGFTRNGKHFDAVIKPAVISDDIGVLTQLAIAGGGITRLVAFVANPYLESGQLKELFTANNKQKLKAEIDPLNFHLCVTDRYEKTPKVRAFVEFIKKAIPRQWR